MQRKRILVVGCGAIGGIFAVHLARVADVVGYDANAAHVASINPVASSSLVIRCFMVPPC